MWLLRMARLLAYVLFGLLCVLLLWPLLGQHRRHRVERWWAGRVMRILRIQVRTDAPWPRAPVMLAINHVSWVDILAINSVSPSIFVAKSEIASWPLAGTLASRAGTIFVERGRRHAVRAVIHSARDTLKAGRTVAVFPEGTTTNGRDVMPFHSNMFQAAVEAGRPVVPLCLRYTERPSGQFSELPAFIGDQSMVENLMVLLKHPTGFSVTLSPLAPIVVDQPEDVSKATGRHQIGEMAHAAIKARLQNNIGS